ncbi:MAG: polysaccharide biosynthesis protein [Clostridia bacterium]|nr:polysaccharide biosynthesis protein [Clostridia bacterium]
MKKAKSGNFIQSTFILMAASIIVKVIGALFSVPLTNLYGADGTAIFNVAYYIYTAMFIISTAGLPVAVSKMVAEAKALGRNREVKRIASVAFRTFICVGVFFTLVMVLGVDAFTHFGGANCRYAVLAVAPTIFFTCIISAIRGYYQGLSNMVPTAISQVIEALGKLIFGLAAAFYLMKKGYVLDIVVAGAIGGVTVGTVLSAIYIVIVRIRDKRHEARIVEDDGQCLSGREILKKLIKLTIPITVGASVLSLTNLIDTFLVLRRLQDGCMMTEPAAQYLYGAYGMAVKFFNLPQTIIVGIGVSIIPAISRALALSSHDRAKSLTESSLRLTGLLAFPCAVGLGVMPRQVMLLLYPRVPEDVAVAAPLLTLLTPAVILVAMVSVTNALLQAMGKINSPVRSMTIGGVVKLVTNFILVGTASINIKGAPIGTCLCYGTITVLNLISIWRAGMRFSFSRVFLKPLLSAGVMGVFAWLLSSPFCKVLGNTVGTLATVAAAAVIYVLMLIAVRALPKEDILMLPKGEKIAKILRMK